jgi:hypothetical protein
MLCNFIYQCTVGLVDKAQLFWLHGFTGSVLISQQKTQSPRRTPLYHREAEYAYLCLLHYNKAQGAHNAGALVEKSQRAVLYHNISIVTAMKTPRYWWR